MTEYKGEELEVCPVCGEQVEKVIPFPKLDGSGETFPAKVRVLCKCKREAEDQRKEQEQKEEEMRRIQELRELSLMDDKLKSASFKTYKVVEENKKIFGIAKKYVDNFEEMYRRNQGIIFWGNVGTGKSFAAAMIANELLNREIPVIMTSFVKLIQGTDVSNYIGNLNRAKLLIIDDLGAERGTDYALEKVYDIIDSRYRSNRPIILTTNLSLREMQETSDMRYSRIYDRIWEMCYPVNVPGMSWRKREAVIRFDEMKKILEA